MKADKIYCSENQEAYAVSHNDCEMWGDVLEEYGEVEYFNNLGEALTHLDDQIMGIKMAIWLNQQKVGTYQVYTTDDDEIIKSVRLWANIIMTPAEIENEEE
jgi:hypothetical protein